MTSRFIEVGAPESCPYRKFYFPPQALFPIYVCSLKCKDLQLYSDSTTCYSNSSKEFPYHCTLKEWF